MCVNAVAITIRLRAPSYKDTTLGHQLNLVGLAPSGQIPMLMQRLQLMISQVQSKMLTVKPSSILKLQRVHLCRPVC